MSRFGVSLKPSRSGFSPIHLMMVRNASKASASLTALRPPDPCPLKLSNFCAMRNFPVHVIFGLPANLGFAGEFTSACFQRSGCAAAPSAFDEGQEVRIDRVGLSGDHAVGKVLIGL